MSLSSEEYLDHLQSTSVRAGFSFDQVVLPDERHVALDGLRFRYLDWGAQGKRPILFLHGGALTAHTWDLCCLALRDEFHCLALDQRGHGDSDWAPDIDYSIAAQREDVRGFAEAVGLDNFVLVGMSMGAINGLAYAIAYPETLSALVLIDALARLLPGALGDERSNVEDSFVQGLLDWPHYTRPEVFRGMRVPEILLSGHHEKIRQWRLVKSIEKTKKLRPELLHSDGLPAEAKELLRQVRKEGDDHGRDEGP